MSIKINRSAIKQQVLELADVGFSAPATLGHENKAAYIEFAYPEDEGGAFRIEAQSFTALLKKIQRQYEALGF